MYKTNHASVDVSQAVVLQRGDGSILLLEDFNGCWNLPGGRLEEGEDWLAGLRREVLEETGIKFFELQGLLNVYLRTSSRSGRQKYGVIFQGITQETDVIVSQEHRSCRWINSILECESIDFKVQEFKKAICAVFNNDRVMALR